MINYNSFWSRCDWMAGTKKWLKEGCESP